MLTLLASSSLALAGPPPSNPSYAVQVGAYTSIRKAAVIRAVLENLGPARVEKLTGDNGEPLYRVLVGAFPDIGTAERFAKESRLKALFPKLWLNPVSLDTPPPRGPARTIPVEELEQDPYRVDMNLHCEDGKRHGLYQAILHPEDKSIDNTVALAVHWNCIPNSPENWLARDQERNPSHWSLAPLMGFGSLSNTGAAAGSVEASDFAYGIQAALFRSFGGMGPTLEYRLLNHRYSAQGSLAGPTFVVEHRLLVGARLPFLRRFEAEPLLGFSNRNFLLGSVASNRVFEGLLIPEMAVRGRVRLIELHDRGYIDFTGGFHYLFSTGSGALDAKPGSRLSFAIRARHFFPDTWGTDWFAEYGSLSQGVGVVAQAESLLAVGVSFMLIW